MTAWFPADRPDCLSPDSLSGDALLAGALLAIAPDDLGGLVLTASPGLERDTWLKWFRSLLPTDCPTPKIPLNIGDDRLLGGLDLGATLSRGRPHIQRGLLAESDGGVLTVAMAERMSLTLAAKLAAALEAREVVLERDGLAARHPSAFGLILLDESLDEEEAPPACLRERLALHLHLASLAAEETPVAAAFDRNDIDTARARLPEVAVGDEAVEALCAATLTLGIDSARAPRFALVAARAAAALAGRDCVAPEDLALAARLVLAPRATQLPAEQAAPQRPSEDSAKTTGDTEKGDADKQAASADPSAIEDLMVAATKAAIPPDLLSRLGSDPRPRHADPAGGRAGSLCAGALRGRPVGVRPGKPGSGRRLNLLETLKAAAPWQRIRRHELPAGRRDRKAPLLIRLEDFRITRNKHRTQTTTIFAVDASGSTALHRLAEAKGALELLLADCYVRRDQVALLTFKGREAELLLPPTRSLTRVKRGLAGFPAGGGTPLAAAIDAVEALATGLRRKGQAPVVVFLTDGRGNIARDGSADRTAAERDTGAAARVLAASGIASLLIDISPRPREVGRRLAEDLRATYVALPQADAASLSAAVRTFAQPAR